jgi:hypothetical protein
VVVTRLYRAIVIRCFDVNDPHRPGGPSPGSQRYLGSIILIISSIHNHRHRRMRGAVGGDVPPGVQACASSPIRHPSGPLASCYSWSEGPACLPTCLPVRLACEPQSSQRADSVASMYIHSIRLPPLTEIRSGDRVVSPSHRGRLGSGSNGRGVERYVRVASG